MSVEEELKELNQFEPTTSSGVPNTPDSGHIDFSAEQLYFNRRMGKK